MRYKSLLVKRSASPAGWQNGLLLMPACWRGRRFFISFYEVMPELQTIKKNGNDRSKNVFNFDVFSFRHYSSLNREGLTTLYDFQKPGSLCTCSSSGLSPSILSSSGISWISSNSNLLLIKAIST